jgi:hypothetical protein
VRSPVGSVSLLSAFNGSLNVEEVLKEMRGL